MSTTPKVSIEKANDLKTLGNTYFQKSQFTKAIETYTSALSQLSSTSLTTESTLLKCTILSNRVACHLKSSQLSEKLVNSLIDDCTIALEEQTLSASLKEKLHYRRAKARTLLPNKSKELLNNAARDIYQTLQYNPKNALANDLLRTIQQQHAQFSKNSNASPVSACLCQLKLSVSLEKIKSLYHIISQDVDSNGIELGRSSDGIQLLLDTASNKSLETKCRSFSLQIISACCSHAPFIEQFYKLLNLDQISKIVSEEKEEEVILAGIAVLLRVILISTELNSQQDENPIEYYNPNVIATTTQTLFYNYYNSLSSFQANNRILYATFDLVSSWISFSSSDMLKKSKSIDDSYLENTKLPTKQKIATEKMKPRELSNHRQKEFKLKKRRYLQICNNSQMFLHKSVAIVLHICLSCSYHIRRDTLLILSKLWNVLDIQQEKQDVGITRLKQILTPIMTQLSNFNTNNGPIIEEIHENQEQELDYSILSELEQQMMKALLITSLLQTNNTTFMEEVALKSLFQNKTLESLVKSQDLTAMSIAAEFLSCLSSFEKGRALITPILSENEALLDKLLESNDSTVKSGAASTLAKLGLGDQKDSEEEGELIGLLLLVADLLQDKNHEHSLLQEEKHSSTVERGIELLNYLCSKTLIKEEITHGFSNQQDLTILQQMTQLSKSHLDNMCYYGLASSFALLCVSIETLRKEAFADKDITPEQYDQMQNLIKTQQEKELTSVKVQEDSIEQVQARIEIMALKEHVCSALVSMFKAGNDAVKEQIVTCFMRMASVVTVRGTMIQEGCLNTCMNVDYKDKNDQQKKILNNSRHALAKLLVTTNPALLTSQQRLGCIPPLLHLVQNHDSTYLAQFEALLSLCNLASLDYETKQRVISCKGISILNYAMFSDHDQVRRAATETMSNLVPHEEMMQYLTKPDNLKLWLAFATDYEDEHYECARAACGCLANATLDSTIALSFSKLEKFKESVKVLLECGHLELMHRLFVIIINMLGHGGKCRKAIEDTAAIAFCQAYLESYGGGAAENKKDELEFSDNDRSLMDVTVGLAKEIVTM